MLYGETLHWFPFRIFTESPELGISFFGGQYLFLSWWNNIFNYIFRIMIERRFRIYLWIISTMFRVGAFLGKAQKKASYQKYYIYWQKVFLMAHTADVKLWSTFKSKTQYFSLVSGAKIEKNQHILVFWALVPWS